MESPDRVGRYNQQKSRLIILKFSFFEDKESVLSKAYKIKGTHFSLEPSWVCRVRQELLQLAKPRGVPFKAAL